MFAVLAASRFIHFTAVCLLFGIAAFPFYTHKELRLDGVLRLFAALAVLTGLAELAAMAANMGGSFASMLDRQVVSSAVTDTAFGRVWVLRLALSVAVLAISLQRHPSRSRVLVASSGVLLVSVALTGHSSMPGGWLGRLHQIADAAHLLAAGWWTGGLFALVLTVRRLGDRTAAVLSRFSGVGYAAVAAIVATGVLKSAILLGSVTALVASDYGRVLLIKVGLFFAMGLLALSNRFQITPALEREDPSVRIADRLRLQVSLEFALGLAVLMVVGALGAMQPPISD